MTPWSLYLDCLALGLGIATALLCIGGAVLLILLAIAYFQSRFLRPDRTRPGAHR